MNGLTLQGRHQLVSAMASPIQNVNLIYFLSFLFYFFIFGILVERADMRDSHI